MLQSKVQAELGSLEIVPLFTSAAKHTIVQITILLLSGYGNTIYRFMACKGTLSKAWYNLLFCYPICYEWAPLKTHCCRLCSLLKWPSLHTLRNIHWVTLIYNTLLGESTPYFSQLLQPKSVSKYNARSSRYIRVKSVTKNTKTVRICLNHCI